VKFSFVFSLFVLGMAVTAPLSAQSGGPAPLPCVINGVFQRVTASGDATTDTANIQGAMDACTVVGAQAGRPLFVEIEPGSYTIKPITMRSYVYLLIPAGAIVNASTVTTDYQIPGKATCGTVSSSSTGCVPLISAGQNSQPAASYSGIIGSLWPGIMGGTIDGHGWDVTSNGSTWWDVAQAAKTAGKKQVNPRLIEFDNGQNIVIRDITLENSPYFHVVFSQCSYVTAFDVTIQTPSPGRSGADYNTDGIDPISSTNVLIANCHIYDGDDNVAITAASKGPSHDITIEHCDFGPGHGVSIGSGTNSGVYNIFVRQCFFDGTDNGLRIKSAPTEGGPVYQIYYDTICMKGINTGSKSSENGAIVLDTQYSSGTGTLYPYYHDIHFHGVYSDTASATISGTAWDNVRLNGAGGTQPISNVSFYDVDFTEPKTASVANIDPASIYLYSNSANLTIPGVSVIPAPRRDPFVQTGPNPNIANFCQQGNF
jgi:polygalacturonase